MSFNLWSYVWKKDANKYTHRRFGCFILLNVELNPFFCHHFKSGWCFSWHIFVAVRFIRFISHSKVYIHNLYKNEKLSHKDNHIKKDVWLSIKFQKQSLHKIPASVRSIDLDPNINHQLSQIWSISVFSFFGCDFHSQFI